MHDAVSVPCYQETFRRIGAKNAIERATNARIQVSHALFGALSPFNEMLCLYELAVIILLLLVAAPVQP